MIGSWFQDSSRINITGSIENPVDFGFERSNEFTDNPIWSISSTELVVQNSSDRLLKIHNISEMHFKLSIKRNPTYFVFENLIPSVVLNLVNLVAFFIPFDMQVGLSNEPKFFYLCFFVVA